MCYEGRKRLYAGGRQSSIAVVVSIVKVPGRGSLLSRQRKDVNGLCRDATAHVPCSGGCTGCRGAFAIVNEGGSGSCRIFQIAGSALVMFVTLVDRELRRREEDYSCSSEGKTLVSTCLDEVQAEACWSRTRGGRMESSCSCGRTYPAAVEGHLEVERLVLVGSSHGRQDERGGGDDEVPKELIPDSYRRKG